MTRAQIEGVLEELRRRRAEGEEGVYLADDTLPALRRAVERAQPARHAPPTPPPEPAPSAPAAPLRAAPPPPPPEPAPIRAAPPASAPEVAPALPPPAVFTLPAGSKQERWDWLRARVLGCPTCLAHTRTQLGKKVVFGTGNLDAKVFFCGEAPGADEEEQGEPFVGRAGQLLDKIITAMGVRRSDVYIGNILNWRPEKPDMTSGNRPPTWEEMQFCLPYLIGQIEVVRPEVVVALGNTAVTGLLGPDPKRRISAIRGCWQEFRGIPLMPTYHPSYLLQYATQRAKREVWEDMLAVMERVGWPISEKQRGFFR